MTSRPEDQHHLPESKVNYFDEQQHPYSLHNQMNGNGNGNGFNKLKLRVPMERRYVRRSLCPPVGVHPVLNCRFMLP